MLTGIKLRAHPTSHQKLILSQWMGCARSIWNAKVEEERYYRTYARKYCAIGTYAPTLSRTPSGADACSSPARRSLLPAALAAALRPPLAAQAADSTTAAPVDCKGDCFRECNNVAPGSGRVHRRRGRRTASAPHAAAVVMTSGSARHAMA